MVKEEPRCLVITEKGIEELERLNNEKFDPCPYCGRNLYIRIENTSDPSDNTPVKCGECQKPYIRTMR